MSSISEIANLIRHKNVNIEEVAAALTALPEETDINQPTANKASLLEIAVTNPFCPKEVITLLKDRGADPFTMGESGFNPVYWAVRGLNPEKLRELLTGYASPSIRNIKDYKNEMNNFFQNDKNSPEKRKKAAEIFFMLVNAENTGLGFPASNIREICQVAQQWLASENYNYYSILLMVYISTLLEEINVYLPIMGISSLQVIENDYKKLYEFITYLNLCTTITHPLINLIDSHPEVQDKWKHFCNEHHFGTDKIPNLQDIWKDICGQYKVAKAAVPAYKMCRTVSGIINSHLGALDAMTEFAQHQTVYTLKRWEKFSNLIQAYHFNYEAEPEAIQKSLQSIHASLTLELIAGPDTFHFQIRELTGIISDTDIENARKILNSFKQKQEYKEEYKEEPIFHTPSYCPDSAPRRKITTSSTQKRINMALHNSETQEEKRDLPEADQSSELQSAEYTFHDNDSHTATTWTYPPRAGTAPIYKTLASHGNTPTFIFWNEKSVSSNVSEYLSKNIESAKISKKGEILKHVTESEKHLAPWDLKVKFPGDKSLKKTRLVAHQIPREKMTTVPASAPASFFAISGYIPNKEQNHALPQRLKGMPSPGS